MYYGLKVLILDNPMLGSGYNKKSIYWSKSKFILSQYANYLLRKYQHVDVQLFTTTTVVDLAKESYHDKIDPTTVAENQLLLIHDSNNTRYAIGVVKDVEKLLLYRVNEDNANKLESKLRAVAIKLYIYLHFINKDKQILTTLFGHLVKVIQYEVTLDKMLLIMELYPNSIYELH